MFRYQSVVGLIALAFVLSGGPDAACRVPDGLQDLLRAHRFNLYTSPAPANNMVLTDLTGRVLNLSALRGKVVILNFWRIDCPPCASEKPILERIFRRLAGRGLEVVAVNLFDNPERLKSYVRDHGFSFKFGFDPENRFSLQKQSLRPGMTTTFVVNAGSEAIYEVPGVPTTYLIDRKGAVVGNSVGMVDWEKRPYLDLLEALLQEHPLTSAAERSPLPSVPVASHSQPEFSDVARQGETQSPLNPSWKHAQFQGPVRQAAPPEQAPPPTGLPFQGSIPQAPETVAAPSAPTAGTPRDADEGQAPARRKPDRAAVKPSGKPQRSRVGGTAQRHPTQPQPVPQTRPGTSRTVQRPAPGSVIQPPPATPQPGAAPVPFPAPTTAGSVVSGNLPPLPPALPYTPPGRSGRRPPVGVPNVVPDDTGNVMARVPSATPGYPGPGVPSQGPGTGADLPPGQWVPANTIDRSILDTFGNLELSKPRAPQPIVLPGQQGAPPDQSAPAGSLLNQLGRDFQNLGAGIKETFSGIWPGQR